MANFKFVFGHLCRGEAGGACPHTTHSGSSVRGLDEMIVVCVEGSSYYSIEGRGPQSVSETKKKLSLLYIKQGRTVSVQHSLFEQSKMLDLL